MLTMEIPGVPPGGWYLQITKNSGITDGNVYDVENELAKNVKVESIIMIFPTKTVYFAIA